MGLRAPDEEPLTARSLNRTLPECNAAGPWEQLELRGLGAVASLAARVIVIGGQGKCEPESRSSPRADPILDCSP